MGDPLPYTDSNGAEPPGTPRWVKAFGIIAIIMILLFVTLHLTGGGRGGH